MMMLESSRKRNESMIFIDLLLGSATPSASAAALVEASTCRESHRSV
jgi:hypothetical protein